MMIMNFYEQQVQLSGKVYTVLVPEVAFLNTFLFEVDTDTYMLFGNQEDLRKLAEVFQISSQEKSKLIYLPLRKNRVPETLQARMGGAQSNDLVIVHHLVQFKVKDWKKVRSLLTKKDLVSYEIPDIDPGCTDWAKFYYKENNDYLSLRRQFDSLFLVGSRMVFLHLVHDCWGVVECVGELSSENTGMHVHLHLDQYIRDHGATSSMTLNFFEELPNEA